MDVHPTKNVSIGIDPYTNLKSWFFFAIPKLIPWYKAMGFPMDLPRKTRAHGLSRGPTNAGLSTSWGWRYLAILGEFLLASI